jgi:rod shape-determining protein MreD
MIIIVLRLLLQFIVLMGIQVVILNHVQLGSFINPFLYVLFLLSLPVNTPKLLLLPLAFFTGLVADMFQNTPGMHASACLLLVYCRPSWLSILAPREGYEPDMTPGLRVMGLGWYVAYAGGLIFMHHFLLFFLEIFRFSEIGSTLARIGLSTCVTLLLVIIAQFLSFNPKNN